MKLLSCLTLLVLSVGCQAGTPVVVRDPYFQSVSARPSGDRQVVLPFKRTAFSVEQVFDRGACVECSVLNGVSGPEDSNLVFNLPFSFTNRSLETWVITKDMFSLSRQDEISMTEPGGIDDTDSAAGEEAVGNESEVLIRVPPGSSAVLPMRFLLTGYMVEEDAYGEYVVTVFDDLGEPILQEKLLVKEYQPVLQVLRITGVILALVGLGAIA